MSTVWLERVNMGAIPNEGDIPQNVMVIYFFFVHENLTQI